MMFFAVLVTACTGKLDHLEPGQGGEPYRLDLRASCVDEFCVGRSTYAAAESIMGVSDGCSSDFSDILETAIIFCDWSTGVSIAFDDENRSGVLGESEVALYLRVDSPWDGTSAQGLGVGSSIGDFVGIYGEPDQDVGINLFWIEDSFSIWDNDDDGLVDGIVLF
jgi:hypothetical protein